MASQAPGVSNLTTLLQSASTAGSATIVRCPATALDRLRHLNEAEIITLFTPFVPHPPSTVLAKNMDPFEPLGRALPRQVRHVPYRLDNGMTETHADFLPASGAIVTVICAASNIVSYDTRAFDRQTEFARDVMRKASEIKSLAGVPAVVLLVTSESARQAHEDGLREFPALVSINEYTPAALGNAVRIIFNT
ncbi:hypothetical protein BS50DRAFT_600080 [Corynespora cassiicola Philippines]|uniref:Uncharacterized protein n=1 Tax=Corynespora cassiicola Philippines TaxID=1448308 RepID=A0A2T2NRY7_CORCC|nr:hypothetical protein BS50DRAFT_600080 [Corynespora cassiicola Philippines]